ncbi:PHP domain-containing protein [Paludicola sp. MB14-C6]|uniref:PHP domain-containing protein n=1 Tax=Paludihabitans sp. MB14-C6 TaxID=3070656 RepID=UPI0027DBB2C9|nr:PHP domain-containing protein [Paludicola sp. MB14-C6]WMJ23635.1 PHP domain-containing protein [Paludicola sp. MB14-C6]
MKQKAYPIKVAFGLEVCYFKEYENLIKDIITGYDYDFITGSVHWVDGFGFDHKKELWDNIDIDNTYKRYYEIMESLIKSKLFTGVAHPDSIKCFGHTPSYDLIPTYKHIAKLLKEYNMYAEQSGGLHLNYHTSDIGMNPLMLKIFKEYNVRMETASDAHQPSHVGVNIKKLQAMIE